MMQLPKWATIRATKLDILYWNPLERELYLKGVKVLENIGTDLFTLNYNTWAM